MFVLVSYVNNKMQEIVEVSVVRHILLNVGTLER